MIDRINKNISKCIKRLKYYKQTLQAIHIGHYTHLFLLMFMYIANGYRQTNKSQRKTI